MTTQHTEMARRPQEQLEHVRDEQRVMPPVDVYENEDEILLLIDVPGVAQEGLDVQLEGGRLDLEARQSALPEGDPSQPLLFARSFSVPNTVDAAKVAAELDAGVLRIHLPKGEAAKPRRIQVKSS